MKFIREIILTSYILAATLLVLPSCGSGASGTTLTGTVDIFVASLKTNEQSTFAKVKDFLLPTSHAAASGITITVGDKSVTTDATGAFTLADIPTGDQTITFTQNSNSATYSLTDIDAGETITLDNIAISGKQVTTTHTGTWTGTLHMSDEDTDMTLTISANGNAFSGTMNTGLDESGTCTGVEKGTSIVGTYTVTGGGCTLSGPLTGTFSGNTLTGNAQVTAQSGSGCDDAPLDDPDDEHAHRFELTKSS